MPKEFYEIDPLTKFTPKIFLWHWTRARQLTDPSYGRHDTPHNDIQLNDTQQNDIQQDN